MAFRNFRKTENQSQNYNDEYYGGQEKEQPEEDFGFGNVNEQAEQKAEPARPAQRRSASLGSTYSMKLMKPASYADGTKIADEIRKGNAVVINTENLNAEVVRSLICFLDGVTYAIDGHLKPVSGTTYMITPQNMEILGLDDEQQEEAPAEEPAPAVDNGYGYQGYGSGFRG